MTPAKSVSLQAYLATLKARAAATDVPAKHKDSLKEYKEYLQLEIRRTTLRLETDSVTEPKSK